VIAVDTNILVFAHRRDSPFHLEGSSRLEELVEGSDPWGLPVSCISEFLNAVTRPRYFNPPSDPKEALGFIAAISSSPSCKVLKPGDNYLDHFFHAMVSGGAKGNLVFDAQIVAVCREHGVDRILTSDRDFDQFEGITVERLGSVHEPSAHYRTQVKVEDFLPT
jgi:toxin-antitoxin system PIN domain toxin